MTQQKKWMSGVIVAGHGVASGRAANSPYPRSTIDMQRPYFEQLGLDLSGMFSGTLNISIHPHRYRLVAPAWTFRQVTWTDRHPPEDFSFCRCCLNAAGGSYEALIYYPHPETKRRNFQGAATLEVLAPYIEGLQPGDAVELGCDPREIQIMGPPPASPQAPASPQS